MNENLNSCFKILNWDSADKSLFYFVVWFFKKYAIIQLWIIPPSPASFRWRGTFWDGTSYSWFCSLCPLGNCPSSESRIFKSKFQLWHGLGITKSDCIGKGLHRFVQGSLIDDLVTHSLTQWHFYFSVYKALQSCRRRKCPSSDKRKKRQRHEIDKVI